MAARIDLVGRRFGRWTVVANAGAKKWFCICDCGTRRHVRGLSLRNGESRSCGCRRKVIDLTRQKFGRWLVIAYAGKSKWSCVCSCGARADVDGRHLRGGQSKSCGCLTRERVTKHGMADTREYQSWEAMKSRCFNPNSPDYGYYGARGISVCAEWLSFEAFFADMGPRPEGCSLDRINVNDDYRPGNVRWADAKQQRRNQRPPKLRIKRGDPKILAGLKQLAESLARWTEPNGSVEARNQ